MPKKTAPEPEAEKPKKSVASEEFRKVVDEQEKLGNVVIMGIEGPMGMPLRSIVLQPTEGLLYDLNRLPEVVWTFIDDPKWVNDYAVYLVIKKLHGEWQQMRQMLLDLEWSIDFPDLVGDGESAKFCPCCKGVKWLKPGQLGEAGHKPDCALGKMLEAIHGP